MSETTANLALPFILPQQAQKHVTHNDALQRLDATVHLAIADTLTTPPSAPQEGSCYLVTTGATGAWAGKAGRIAAWLDGDWLFLTPRPGWCAWFAAEQQIRIFDAGTWQFPRLPPQGSMQELGIAATADANNRLAVSSPASLFNNAGSGHQIKVNKAAAGDTASLLFQTGWSGRAEMGLAGNDLFSIKVSPDGSAWMNGLSISPEGRVHMPNKPAARVSLAAGITSPANGAETGFDALHVNQGGFVLGTTIGASAGKRLVVPATGAYLVGLSAQISATAVHGISVRANGSTALTGTSGISTGGNWVKAGASAIVALNAGDWLSLFHNGSAQVDFGSGKTELSIFLL